MSNIAITTPALNSAAAAVVQNDTSMQAQPAITLEGRNYSVNVVIEEQTAEKPLEQLKSLEAARRGWESTELVASNKRLYAILTKAFAFYLTMKGDPDKETRAQYVADLANFIAERGYAFTPSSHDMTRVVKCVFGVDRRRVSAYSIALREALRQNVGAEDLADFLEQNGGVEQVRLGGTKPLSVTKRADKIKHDVISTDLGSIKLDAAAIGANSDWNDKQVVIVATYQPTGEFLINAVVRHDTAVNTALAACYSKQQAEVREEKKAERESAAFAKAAEAFKAEQEKLAAAIAKQKARVEALQAQKQSHAANNAHAESFMEPVAA